MTLIILLELVEWLVSPSVGEYVISCKFVTIIADESVPVHTYPGFHSAQSRCTITKKI
jgi:hypothetical protein